jgi:hypothetical protein
MINITMRIFPVSWAHSSFNCEDNGSEVQVEEVPSPESGMQGGMDSTTKTPASHPELEEEEEEEEMGFELQYESSRQTLYHLPLQHARFTPASRTTTTRVGSKHTIICITPYPSHNESSLAIVSQDYETRLDSGDHHHKDHNPKDAFQDAGSGR